MGKSTRRKQAKLEAQEEQVAARLTASHVGGKRTRGIITAHTEGVMTEALELLEPHYIRPIEDWVYNGKSNNVDKQRRSLLRHLCGVYTVPPFLENPMIGDDNRRLSEPVLTALSGGHDGSILPWYVAVAQGQSLYKTCTRGVLTKRETHLLLQAPKDLNIKQAIWWARAMALSDNIGVAYRVARSLLTVRSHIKSIFWIDVHRFFTNNPVQLKEMNELLDYIISSHQESGTWTIKKRSLEAVRRKSEEWHRAQYKMKYIGGGSWTGMEDIPTWKHKTGKFNINPHKSTEVEWKIEQIVTGNRLAQEGQRMRHCVASYKRACMEGRTSIFSMTSSNLLKPNQRNLTIEVHVSTRNIIQALGYVNRFATPAERNILSKWATENRITSRSIWL